MVIRRGVMRRLRSPSSSFPISNALSARARFPRSIASSRSTDLTKFGSSFATCPFPLIIGPTSRPMPRLCRGARQVLGVPQHLVPESEQARRCGSEGLCEELGARSHQVRRLLRQEKAPGDDRQEPERSRGAGFRRLRRSSSTAASCKARSRSSASRRKSITLAAARAVGMS